MDPLIFSFQQIKALLTQREESGSTLENFVEQLSTSTERLEANKAKYKANKNYVPASFKRHRFRIIEDFLYHWRQARRLMEATSKNCSLCIFGIDPKRLDLVEGDLPGQIVTHISKSVLSNNVWSDNQGNFETLIFDPKLDIEYRSVSHLTDTLILSPLSIVCLVFQNPKYITTSLRAFKYGWESLDSFRPAEDNYDNKEEEKFADS